LKPLFIALRRVLQDLGGRGVALVGGLAVGARTISRFTTDLDLAVSVVSDKDAEQLVGHLVGRGYRIVAQVEHLDTLRFATVRLHPPAGLLPAEETPIVDLLFATTGIEPEIVAAAEPLALGDGLTLPVARTGHLIAMKALSQHPVRRPQDRVDLVRLIEHATPDEVERARAAVRSIVKAGCARDQDLVAVLEGVLDEVRRDADPTFRPRPLPPAPPAS
jgi:hypothetical protein